MDVPASAPEHCPGTQSEQAGKSSSCAGCPNQQVCSSGKARDPDPAIERIMIGLLPVKHKILVLSGKGGVGKSTFSTCLARAFAYDQTLKGPSEEQIYFGSTGSVIIAVQSRLKCFRYRAFFTPCEKLSDERSAKTTSWALYCGCLPGSRLDYWTLIFADPRYRSCWDWRKSRLAIPHPHERHCLFLKTLKKQPAEVKPEKCQSCYACWV